ncbi:MAG: molybdenum cofactor biosynthesis protein MoaD [Anaerolineaceae bacterium]|nr:molybdenum cofactor biosynthesis protein MoaD [Anaerolineaceae bacterium]
MPNVHFTTHLQRFFPTLQQGTQADGQTVAEVVRSLEQQHPGLAAYIVDEQGALRKHVNIFVNDELVIDRQKLSDVVGQKTRVFIFQALSGG